MELGGDGLNVVEVGLREKLEVDGPFGREREIKRRREASVGMVTQEGGKTKCGKANEVRPQWKRMALGKVVL